jgi:hypothetical protein
VALFGITAKQWSEKNQELMGDGLSSSKPNMRDYASINELMCFANMKNLNAFIVQEQKPQKERLFKLNQIAI